MKVIRNTLDHDEFWTDDPPGWTTRDMADELDDSAVSLPKGGEFVDPRHGWSYKIVRKFKDPNKEDELIAEDLTFDEARDHCSDPSSSGDGWMDVWYRED